MRQEKRNQEHISVEISRTNANFVKFVEDLEYGEFYCIVRSGDVVQVREPKKDRRFDINS